MQLGAAVGGAVGGLRLRRRRRLRGLLALVVAVVVVVDPYLAPLVAGDLRRRRRRDLRRRRLWLGDVVFDRLRAAAARAPLDEEVGGAGPRTLRLRRRRRDARWGLRRLARRQRAARRWRGRRGNRECRGGCSDGTWPEWPRAGAERWVGPSGVEGAGAGGGIAGRGARLSVDIDASGAPSVAPSCTPSSAAAPSTGTAASTGCVGCVAISTASSILRKARRGGSASDGSTQVVLLREPRTESRVSRQRPAGEWRGAPSGRGRGPSLIELAPSRQLPEVVAPPRVRRRRLRVELRVVRVPRARRRRGARARDRARRGITAQATEGALDIEGGLPDLASAGVSAAAAASAALSQGVEMGARLLEKGRTTSEGRA